MAGADVYEVLPGPAAIDASKSPTPFSNKVAPSQGSYSLEVRDLDAKDSTSSKDAVTSVDIRFTAANGASYRIDAITVIHKAEGSGDHSFLGGVAHNVQMHGDSGIGTALMPKMLSYITLWGVADLKDGSGKVIAKGRVVHIMTAARVRDSDKKLLTEVADDRSDPDRMLAETHVILPPTGMDGNKSPIPGTAHGFLHMMFSKVELTKPSRDPALAYEILPGPAAINPAMAPTPFSNRIAVAAGSYSLKTRDFDKEDSATSRDVVDDFKLRFRLANGTEYTIDSISVIHKPVGTGDHSFLGGVGYDVTMHGDTKLGTSLMPKMTSYITLWGTADLKDGSGAVVAAKRMIHLMVGSRVRDAKLVLGTDTATDASDRSNDKVETHIILPPLDLAGKPSRIPNTPHGFLHLMFEKVTLAR